MCDASDYAVGAVLGQRKEGRVHAVYYASKTLNEAQLNYATTEKKLLAVSYGPPSAHYLGGYQHRLLGGTLGLLGLCHTAPDGVGRKDFDGQVLG
jgi:hypothetical protein